MMIVMMTSTLRMLLPSFGGRLYRQSTTPRFCFDDDVLDEQAEEEDDDDDDEAVAAK